MDCLNKMRILNAFIVIVFTFTPVFSNGYDWWERLSSLKILKSTEREVVINFGKPSTKNRKSPLSNSYSSKLGWLWADYAKADCFDNKGKLIVPKNSLIYISFEPEERIEFSSFIKKVGIHLKEYEATTQKGSDTSLVYTDYDKPDDGITINSTQDQFSKKWYLDRITISAPSSVDLKPCRSVIW